MSSEQREESDPSNIDCNKNNEPIESGNSSKSNCESIVSDLIGDNRCNDKSSVAYEGDKCVYTDPSTKCRYMWDNDKKDWVPEQQPEQSNIDRDGDYEFDGTTYSCVDKKTGVKYRWDTDKSEWALTENQQITETDGTSDVADKKDGKNGNGKTFAASGVGGSVYGYENDTHTYTDPADNTVYIWDKDKSAWFPKVDDNFLAHYQMNYGFIDPNKDSLNNQQDIKTKSNYHENSMKQADDVKGEKRKAQQQEPTWFEIDEQTNTKVYVSNLPSDIIEKEFVDLMQKCGLVMKDINTGKMKVKLYTEPGTNRLKGDGLCTYIKKESVDLALNLLDGYDYKGCKLRVERARFTMKGDAYDPSLKPKKKKKKELEKLKKQQEKLFDWRPDKLRGERSRNESVVIVKNLFEPSTFDKDVKLILEYQQDLRDECQKLGAVKRVIIYDRHPEGVAQINFKEPEAADACIQLMNGRWFNKRQITAETWDGKTKYKIIETEEELKNRMEKWDSFLLSDKERKAEPAVFAASKAGEQPKEEENKRVDEKTTVDFEERDSDEDTKSSGGSDEELECYNNK